MKSTMYWFLCGILFISVTGRFITVFNTSLSWLDAHGKCMSMDGHLAGNDDIEKYLDDITIACNLTSAVWLGNFSVYTPILRYEGHVIESALTLFIPSTQRHYMKPRDMSREQCSVTCMDFDGFAVSTESCHCIGNYDTVRQNVLMFNTPSQEANAGLYLYHDKVPNTTSLCVLEYCKASVDSDVKSSSPEVENCSLPVEAYVVCRDILSITERDALSRKSKTWSHASDTCQRNDHDGLIGKLDMEQCRRLRLVYGDSVMNTYMWSSIRNYQESYNSSEFSMTSLMTVYDGSVRVSWLRTKDNATIESFYLRTATKANYICITDGVFTGNKQDVCELDTAVLDYVPTTEVLDEVTVIWRSGEGQTIEEEDSNLVTVIIIVAVLVFIVIVCVIARVIVYMVRNKRDQMAKLKEDKFHPLSDPIVRSRNAHDHSNIKNDPGETRPMVLYPDHESGSSHDRIEPIRSSNLRYANNSFDDLDSSSYDAPNGQHVNTSLQNGYDPAFRKHQMARDGIKKQFKRLNQTC